MIPCLIVRSIASIPPWDLGPKTMDCAQVRTKPILLNAMGIYFFWRLCSWESMIVCLIRTYGRASSRLLIVISLLNLIAMDNFIFPVISFYLLLISQLLMTFILRPLLLRRHLRNYTLLILLILEQSLFNLHQQHQS